MAKFKVYGSPKSQAARVIWFMEEASLEYDVIPLDFSTQEHKGEEYLKINPNGLVPALIDESVDLTMFESIAINLYLAENYAPQFLGNGQKEKGLVLQWSVWIVAHSQPRVEPFFKAKRGGAEAEELAKHSVDIDNDLAIVEKALEGKEYLVGDQFTVADIHVGFGVNFLNQLLGYDISKYPNLVKYTQKLGQRPALVAMMSK